MAGGLQGDSPKPRGFLHFAQSSPGHPTPILSNADGILGQKSRKFGKDSGKRSRRTLSKCDSRPMVCSIPGNGSSARLRNSDCRLTWLVVPWFRHENAENPVQEFSGCSQAIHVLPRQLVHSQPNVLRQRRSPQRPRRRCELLISLL